MATQDEIIEALADFSIRCNGNDKLRKMLRDWTRIVHFRASDTGDSFAVRIENGEIVSRTADAKGDADLVVSASSEDLCDLFWGDLNPVQKYLTGEIQVRGAAADVMRIDAMSSVMWSG
jgi:putative sterol carrier protein